MAPTLRESDLACKEILPCHLGPQSPPTMAYPPSQPTFLSWIGKTSCYNVATSQCNSIWSQWWFNQFCKILLLVNQHLTLCSIVSLPPYCHFCLGLGEQNLIVHTMSQFALILFIIIILFLQLLNRFTSFYLFISIKFLLDRSKNLNSHSFCYFNFQSSNLNELNSNSRQHVLKMLQVNDKFDNNEQAQPNHCQFSIHPMFPMCFLKPSKTCVI